MIDSKMLEIAKRRGFTSFWEAFDYMLLANYSELEALMVGLEMFDGKVWDEVINATCKIVNNNEIYAFSSSTSTNSVFFDSRYTMSIDPCEPDDLLVEVFIMTKEANQIYMPIYKSYIETRKYAEIPMLEKHIKIITLKLTTELAINLFKEGCKNKLN